MLRNSSPRFVALARGPRFGGRDEIIGWTPWHVEATAETRAWLDVLMSRLPEYYNELQWRIVDNDAERVAENWGPTLPPWTFVNDAGALEADDLPF